MAVVVGVVAKFYGCDYRVMTLLPPGDRDIDRRALRRDRTYIQEAGSTCLSANAAGCFSYLIVPAVQPFMGKLM